MERRDGFRLSKIDSSRPGVFGKKGLSNLIAYVLLISITISLSVMVYGWLKFYVERDNIAECSGNVNIIIEGYECVKGPSGNLTVHLRNKGFFDVDGFILRVHDREGAEFGIYIFDDEGSALSPGDDYSMTYEFDDAAYTSFGIEDVTLVDIQPYINESGKVACEAYASQRVTCD